MTDYGLEELSRLYLAQASSPTIRRSTARDDTPARGIEEFMFARAGSLGALLTDIQNEINNRRTLSKTLLTSIEEHYLQIKAKLLELKPWPLSGNRAIELRRSNLEEMLDTLLAEQRREATQRWQDIAKLKSELRSWQKQYADLAQRANFLLPDEEPRPP